MALGRMSYSIYLLNPLILNLFYFMTENSFHCDYVSLPVIVFGVTTITFLVAFVYMLIFESPINALIAVIFDGKKRKCESKQLGNISQKSEELQVMLK